MVSGDFIWFWMVSGGFGWYLGALRCVWMVLDQLQLVLVTFQLIVGGFGWYRMVLGGFWWIRVADCGWLRMVVGGFKCFRVICCFISYDRKDVVREHDFFQVCIMEGFKERWSQLRLSLLWQMKHQYSIRLGRVYEMNLELRIPILQKKKNCLN